MIDNFAIILAVFTAIASAIGAIASVISSLRTKKIEDLKIQLDKEKAKRISTKNELYKVYLNVSELLKIEKELSDELDVGKKITRNGHTTDRYIQPKRVQTRINELEKEV